MNLPSLPLAVLALLAFHSPAQAQSTPDAPPVVVPALPPTSPGPGAPTSFPPTAPAVPALPAVPTPAALPTAPAVLRLTARPGTYGEYATTVRIRVQLTDMQFEAQPGKTVKAADLAALNAKAGAQRTEMNAMMGKTVTSQFGNQMGKAFVRVQPPVNGNSVVLTTTVLNVPDVARPGKTLPASVGITLTYDPSGRVVGAAATSTDPLIQKVYQALDLNTLIQNAQGSGSGSLYGQPLVPGQGVARDTTVDAQSMFQALLGAAGPDAQKLQAQSRPLVTHVTTTYTGKDDQGRLLFSQAVSAEPWNVSLKMSDLNMQFAVTGVRGGGTSVMRPDGMIQTTASEQDMTMLMKMDLPGEPYRMVMKVQYTISSGTALKKLTLP